MRRVKQGDKAASRKAIRLLIGLLTSPTGRFDDIWTTSYRFTVGFIRGWGFPAVIRVWCDESTWASSHEANQQIHVLSGIKLLTDANKEFNSLSGTTQVQIESVSYSDPNVEKCSLTLPLCVYLLYVNK